MSAVSCPEITDGRYAGDFGNHARKKNAAMTVRHGTDAISRHAVSSRKKQDKKLPREKEYNVNETVRVTGTDRIASISKSEYSEALTASTDNSFFPNLGGSSGIYLRPETGSKGNAMDSGFDQDAGCDTIILKSGSRIIGRVEEIGQSEIRYRRCDNITGPIISIAKSGVNRILYVNGTHEVMVSDSPIAVNNVNVKPVYSNAPLKTEPLAIVGLYWRTGRLIYCRHPAWYDGSYFRSDKPW